MRGQDKRKSSPLLAGLTDSCLTEGFDITDLQETKAVLETLSSPDRYHDGPFTDPIVGQ